MMCFLGTRSLAVLFGALLFAGPALAEELRAGALVIDQAFSRATAGAGVPGVAYLRIRNTGAEPDRLLSASTPAAGQASLHASLRQGDVMRMRELTAIDVPPGTTVALSPEGRLHLMLEDLHARLRPGDTVVLTLRIERAGEVQVNVPVGRVGAAAPGPDHAGHAAQ